MPAPSDLVHETSIGTGTGNIDLINESGKRSFNTAFGNGVTTNVFDYFISHRTAAEWERGTGHMSDADTLVRDTVIASSNANAAVNFAAGTKDVTNDIPAPDQLYKAIVAIEPGGRGTLSTGVPVMPSTVAAATTVYYTPYLHDKLPIYDGTRYTPTTFTELSVATTDTTKSPAAIGASKVNDWFGWSDSGTLRIGHGPDWTSDILRSAGTALVRVGGILLNNASITNGPAASRGTYLFTTRSNSSSQIDYIFGASAAGGTAAFFGLWNMYNRVDVKTAVTDSTASWSQATAAGVQSSNDSTGNRISAVFGLAEDGVGISFLEQCNTGTTLSDQAVFGFGIDSTSAFDKSATIYNGIPGGASNSLGSTACAHAYGPQIGFHFWQALEQSVQGTNTFIGGARFSLSGSLRM